MVYKRKVVGSLGFTLIELLVVIAIIGILAGLSTFGFQGARESARDTQRKSDLEQYKSALEVFANANNGLYPSQTSGNGVSASAILCTDLGLSSCPDDPTYAIDTSWQRYLYQSNGSGSPVVDATDYVLWAELERDENGGYWVVCSNGKSGQTSTDIPPSLGVCPPSL